MIAIDVWKKQSKSEGKLGLSGNVGKKNEVVKNYDKMKI